MSSIAIARVVAYCLAAITLLSGCARALNPTPPSPGLKMSSAQPDARKYQVLHSFSGEPDGQTPLEINFFSGSLFGTTQAGGSTGRGTVFRSSLSGKTSVIYSFKGGNDGFEPSGGLTPFHGSFYGATFYGGGGSCSSSNGCGTIYAVDSTGTERVVYRFKANKNDGWYPDGPLVSMNGVLYGTTFSGGAHGYGTVFSVTPSGTENIIHSFRRSSDGASPSGSLIKLSGLLYGTTVYGGKANEGTVFAMTPFGKETVLHQFQGITDGSEPNSLIAAHGVLYGTTTFGGSQTCEGGGRPCGVVFSVAKSGHEKVLYRFQGYDDGALPNSLIWLNGQLYGTTLAGGVSGQYGTIFSLTRSRIKNTLYRFKGTPDGNAPGGLTVVNGLLYGTTGAGGTGGTGRCGFNSCGTIYRIAP